MTTFHHWHERSRQDRWVLRVASGTLVLLLSVFLIWAKQLIQTKPESSVRTWKLEFHTGQRSSIASQLTYSFKILQLADIHLGEDSWTDWGPQQDVKTFHVLDSLIVAEKPDLIVLSGDQLTANNIDENATSYYRSLGQRLSYYGVPWATIFGNHDDAPLEVQLPNGTMINTGRTKTSRQQLLAVEQKFSLSLTRSTPGVFGSSNYVLNVNYPSTWSPKEGDVAVQLFFLDSGGGSLVAQLEQSQIDWFQRTHRPDIPAAVVFQHIPSTDFVYDGSACHGLHDDGIDPMVHDPGIVQVLQRTSNVQWLAVGHNHGNDYCCSTNGARLHLCFGRHSGYGGYGRWERGARIYQLELEGTASEPPSLKWRSWVRLENGTIIDRYEPDPTP